MYKFVSILRLSVSLIIELIKIKTIKLPQYKFIFRPNMAREGI